jgi:hypothetical protein
MVGDILLVVIHLNIFEYNVDEFEPDKLFHFGKIHLVVIIADHIDTVNEDIYCGDFPKNRNRIIVFEVIDCGCKIRKQIGQPYHFEGVT